MIRAFLTATALTLAVAPIAFAQAASPSAVSAGHGFHPNSIPPETTLNISAEATVRREPDIAYITAGVTEERKTAGEAMKAQAAAMTGVFKAVEAAGVNRKDMQTSGLSLSPRYDYIEVQIKEGETRGEQRLAGYVASNQLTVRVRDLDNLGKTIDSLVSAGGNTFSGVSFALDEDGEARNEARRLAMTDALAKGELYASAAGLRIARIVTINEGYEQKSAPMPIARMAMADASMEQSTPVAGGEVSFIASVSVMFELAK